jgi:NodT family efflux transporter outer membrane factor (OMF) lipoprotein
MRINNIVYSGILFITVLITGCQAPKMNLKQASKDLPEKYRDFEKTDTNTVASTNWKSFFDDEKLISLIDTALKNNQELKILEQEIFISKNEIRERKGEYLPFVNIGATSDVEKVGKYTRNGAVEDQLEIRPGEEFPEPLSNFSIGAMASWELDVWKKLRNRKKAAVFNYLESQEVKHLAVTHLVAEIAESYYELMTLDNLLEIIRQNAELQTNALKKVKLLKSNAKATQLAVNRFEAQLLNTQNLKYAIQQNIVETENRIHFLTGSYPKDLPRNSDSFMHISLDSVSSGIPSQLLSNRPDIRQAEYAIEAANLNVKAAKAEFYPSLSINAGVGYEAFNAKYLFRPEALIYNLAGDIVAPLINRNAIKARYNSANAEQIQAVLKYEQTLINAYTDVLNQMSKLNQFSQSFDTKSKEVEILNQSTRIANSLFNSARADYVEVLLTQEEALESKMELVEIKLKQIKSKIQIYRSLGGGWQS